MALALQLRAAAAVQALLQIDPAELSSRQRTIRDCMIGRFSGDNAYAMPQDEPPDWSDALIHAFHRYWRRRLLEGPGDGLEAESLKSLLHDIRSVVPGADRSEASTLDELEPYVVERLSSIGLHAQMGVTPPLRELIVWGRQASRLERVDLPSGTEEIRVELMSDFRSRGWADYATCGRSSAGGWVAEDRLFAVRDRYDLDSEQYRVSYLAHEAQHFADRRAFGSEALAPWRMEYRAKLVELILADSTQRGLLRSFSTDRSPDESIPHSHANDVLIRRLTSWLLPSGSAPAEGGLLDQDPKLVRAAAERLLEEDTRSPVSARQVNRAESNQR